MWDLGNRGVVALISVLSGCVFLYNVWGPILVVTVSFFLVVYACYSLVINDSLLSPHAFLLIEYCKQTALDVRAILESSINHISFYVRKSWENVSERYRNCFLTAMDRRRSSNYQLSSDSYATTRKSSRFSLIAQISPIPRTAYKPFASDTGSESNAFNDSGSSYDHSALGQHTLSSRFSPNKSDSENGLLVLHSTARSPSKKSPMYAQNHTLTRGENTTYFSPEGSPWGTSISPKMRPKAAGVKTVQTVAGPLLASTRYNIDPKVYNDVTSPGLTTRLTKYATEANTKLTHQAQYCTGQFPKVNLHASPIPLINSKCMKMRMPVTVRVAPPDSTRYSPPEGQKALFSLCHSESKSPPSVVQALREISLKRHASREDVSDLVKKQRTNGIICEEFEALDETKQKRSRDESSKSEEEISPQNKSVRPAKRTKTPSCYDILNSLSSSKHVVSGVKRKARDFSRSGTPDFEKHFKSLESVQNFSVQALPSVQDVKLSHSKQITTEKSTKSFDVPNTPNKYQEQSPIKGILKTSTKNTPTNPAPKNTQGIDYVNTPSPKTRSTESPMSAESVKLTDKLFMRAEPQRNEKLRLIVEEQGNIRAKFTTDDVEEIKKEDIVNMRQTSMKARLQSMFDAISGKATSRINPDVVIQAEEVNVAKSPISPATCATLNSSTTTTNVNTTPISTSAVAPASEPTTKTTKHVAFNIPKTETMSPILPIAQTSEKKGENVTPDKDVVKVVASLTKPVAKPVVMLSSTTSNVSNPTTTMETVSKSMPSFAFTPSSTAKVPPSDAFTFGVVSPSTTSISTAPTSLPTTSAVKAFESNIVTPKPTFTSGVSNAFAKAEGNQSNGSSMQTVTTTSVPASSAFSFGSTVPIATVASVTPLAPTTTQSKTQSVTITPSTTFKSITSTSVTSPATTSSLFSFGSKTNTLPAKAESFAFGASVTTSQNTSAFGTTISQGNFQTTTNTSTPAPIALPSYTTTGAFSRNTSADVKSPPPAFGPTSSTFTFGTPSSVPNSKPAFSFGTTTGATTPLTSTANTSAFGTPSTTPSISFGSTATTIAPQFGAPSTSMFGNASGSSIFGSSSSQPVFGTPSTTGTSTSGFGTPKTTASIFAANTNTTTSGLAAANATPIFSNTSASSSTITANPTPIFGANTSLSGIASTSSNLFSNTTGNVNATPATTASAFATTGNNIFSQSKSSGTFGNGPTVFGSNPTSLFGSQTTPGTAGTFGGTVTTSTTTAPAFGSTNVSTVSSATPAFGSTNTATSAFGTRPIATLGTQNPTTQPFATPTPTPTPAPTVTTTAPGTLFENAAPIFGASGSGAFSSTSNAFGGQNVNLAFGGTSTSTPAFGENKSPFGVQSTPAFGASTTAFGTTAGNSGSNIFTFGANQKPAQQSNTFAFGGNNTGNNNPTPSTSTPFQFGASTSKPDGFNFSTPSTTPSISFGGNAPPTFNASAPGMFSIGSGSTAPRSRNVRTRRPR